MLQHEMILHIHSYQSENFTNYNILNFRGKGYSLYRRLVWPLVELVLFPIGITRPSGVVYAPLGSGQVIPTPEHNQ